jgi:TPR repeat protein
MLRYPRRAFMRYLKHGSLLRAAKYGLVAIAIIANSAFGETVAEPGERTVSIFVKPMITLASIDTATVDAYAAVALRAVNLQRPLGRQEAEARYRDGLDLARARAGQAALIAFQEAADSGYGMAQRKLGDIYGTGYDGFERDYETSLRWYQRARNQGIEIPNKPFRYPGVITH